VKSSQPQEVQHAKAARRRSGAHGQTAGGRPLLTIGDRAASRAGHSEDQWRAGGSRRRAEAEARMASRFDPPADW